MWTICASCLKEVKPRPEEGLCEVSHGSCPTCLRAMRGDVQALVESGQGLLERFDGFSGGLSYAKKVGVLKQMLIQCLGREESLDECPAELKQVISSLMRRLTAVRVQSREFNYLEEKLGLDVEWNENANPQDFLPTARCIVSLLKQRSLRSAHKLEGLDDALLLMESSVVEEGMHKLAKRSFYEFLRLADSICEHDLMSEDVVLAG